MSDLRIALVAEGRTDYEIVHAALKAILPKPFVLTLLQPEETQPRLGQGWSGVLKWCMAAAQRYPASLDDDPTLAHFDLLVLHLDADVALKDYEDCGPDVMRLAAAQGWKTLPCAKPCPPAADTCDEIEQAIRSWLAPATVGNRTVVCVPAQSSGTWLAAATLPTAHALLAGVECNPAVESRLETLPLKLRIRKSAREYQARAVEITREWAKVKSLCSQAEAFEQAVQAVA